MGNITILKSFNCVNEFGIERICNIIDFLFLENLATHKSGISRKQWMLVIDIVESRTNALFSRCIRRIPASPILPGFLRIICAYAGNVCCGRWFVVFCRKSPVERIENPCDKSLFVSRGFA